MFFLFLEYFIVMFEWNVFVVFLFFIVILVLLELFYKVEIEMFFGIACLCFGGFFVLDYFRILFFCGGKGSNLIMVKIFFKFLGW